MQKTPTYTAKEIKEKVLQVNDMESYKILANLIDEEIDLYEPEDVHTLMDASMMLFTRCLLFGSMKLLK